MTEPLFQNNVYRWGIAQNGFLGTTSLMDAANEEELIEYIHRRLIYAKWPRQAYGLYMWVGAGLTVAEYLEETPIVQLNEQHEQLRMGGKRVPHPHQGT